MNNLNDPGSPYSCEQWGDMHVNNPTIVEGDNYVYLNMFDCNNSFPCYVFIDHHMVVHWSGSYYDITSLYSQQLDEMLAVYDAEISDDPDEDGIPYFADNCPEVYNPYQENGDTDALGDACDNCPEDFNPGQEDMDNDGLGDGCDNCYSLAGDVNGDLTVNVLDILLTVNYILDTSDDFSDCQFENANISTDEVVDVLDIIQIVIIIMSG